MFVNLEEKAESEGNLSEGLVPNPNPNSTTIEILGESLTLCQR